jgi:hypothetical protein
MVYFSMNQYHYYRQSKAWLLIASLFFYGWWNPWHLPLILGSIAFNFVIARWLQAGAKPASGAGSTARVADM